MKILSSKDPSKCCRIGLKKRRLTCEKMTFAGPLIHCVTAYGALFALVIGCNVTICVGESMDHIGRMLLDAIKQNSSAEIVGLLQQASDQISTADHDFSIYIGLEKLLTTSMIKLSKVSSLINKAFGTNKVSYDWLSYLIDGLLDISEDRGLFGAILPSVNDILGLFNNRPGGFDLVNYMTSIGYPIEIHHVITEDGYVLELHRIPHGRGNRGNTSIEKPACLFVHGLLSSSPDFLVLGPGRSLPLQLADLDYDVWLGNNRGNRYSRSHIILDPNKAAFWNFSFEDLGTKDLPAMIDYILNQTKQAKVTYIGHSQGNTQVLALLALKPEYNDKFTLLNTFAPCAYMGDVTNLIFRFLGLFENRIEAVAKILAIYEVLPYRKNFGQNANDACDLDYGCRAILYIIGGYTTAIDWDIVPKAFQTFPSGSSLKATMHIAQLVHTGEYKRYDYGRSNNILIYGSEKPPAYNLSKVDAAVAVYYGESDNLTSLKTINRLVSELPNVVLKYPVPFKYFAHFDFLAAKDINNLLYNEVIENINKYNNRR